MSRPAKAGQIGYRLEIDAFSLRPGDRISLIGRSGSGKSTILELLAFLLRPQQLDLFRFGGEDIRSLVLDSRKDQLAALRSRNLAYSPQNGGLLPYLSTFENAALAGRLAGRDAAELRQDIFEAAEHLGIRHLLQKSPSELSGGERHRASLLRIAATKPRAIIVDEPTAALDQSTAKGVMAALLQLAERAGAAIVCASHDVAMMRGNGFAIAEVHVATDKQGDMQVASLAAA